MRISAIGTWFKMSQSPTSRKSCCASQSGPALPGHEQRSGAWEEAERIRALFRPLEDLRNAINPIRVLHRAVAGAGIAPTGPLLPLLSNVEAEHEAAIDAAASALIAADRAVSA